MPAGEIESHPAGSFHDIFLLIPRFPRRRYPSTKRWVSCIKAVSYTHLRKEIEPFYEIIVTTEDHLDRIEVRVEFSDASLLDDYNKLEQLRAKIRHNIKSVLNIDAKISLVTPGTLPRFEGKAKRVIDKRTHK